MGIMNRIKQAVGLNDTPRVAEPMPEEVASCMDKHPLPKAPLPTFPPEYTNRKVRRGRRGAQAAGAEAPRGGGTCG